MSSRIWEDLSSLFPEAEHHYIDYADCTEPAHYRAAVRRLLDSGSDGRPWSLVGWSLGGVLALEEVICGQVAVESVVLIGTTLKFTHDDRTKGWPKRVLERMIKQVRSDPQTVVKQFAASMLTPEELAWVERERLLGYAAETHPAAVDSLIAGLSLLLESDLTGLWAMWRAWNGETGAAVVEAAPGAVSKTAPEGALETASGTLSNRVSATASAHVAPPAPGDGSQSAGHSRLRQSAATECGLPAEPFTGSDEPPQPAHKPRLLWIHGQADTICPPGCMPGDLTERERIVLPAVGHAPMVTQLARLEHDIRGFWHGDG